MERERVEREQEELLTRRFTSSNENEEQNKFSESFIVDLKNEDCTKNGNKSNTLTLNKLRNQKPLVKRVRTRYLDFSIDFLGMTKMFLKYSCIDLLILSLCSLIIFLGVFFIIIWQTSPRQFH